MIYRLNMKCNKGHEAIVTEIHFDLQGNFIFTSQCDKCQQETQVSFDYFTAILQNTDRKES